MNSGNSTELKKGFAPLETIGRHRRARGFLTGFTTGTCAQAATKAACIMLATQEPLNDVEVETPCGARLKISLEDVYIGKDFAACSVIKDAGDDIDVTHGIKICAEVRVSSKKGVGIKGGEGVGRVTKPGLAVGVGEWAINPVPRRMILKEASDFLDKSREGLEVTISVPNGERLAKKTFNPKLGIVGGISIIGTTGIVEPKSLDAYKASLALELNILKAQGYKKAVFVLGYVGEKFCKETLKLKEDEVIKIGDHIGFMLKEAVKRKIKKVLLIGHIGKMIKITNGQFNTHYKFGDERVESIARYAKLCGADNKIIEHILKLETAEACVEILNEAGLMKVFDRIARDVSRKSQEFINNQAKVDCIILSFPKRGHFPKSDDGIAISESVPFLCAEAIGK